jgi:hypothetical protein
MVTLLGAREYKFKKEKKEEPKEISNHEIETSTESIEVENTKPIENVDPIDTQNSLDKINNYLKSFIFIILLFSNSNIYSEEMITVRKKDLLDIQKTLQRLQKVEQQYIELVNYTPEVNLSTMSINVFDSGLIGFNEHITVEVKHLNKTFKFKLKTNAKIVNNYVEEAKKPSNFGVTVLGDNETKTLNLGLDYYGFDIGKTSVHYGFMTDKNFTVKFFARFGL